MDRMTWTREMEEALATLTWLDPHTHVDVEHMAARGLDDILLYHMSISDLYAAGCPSGARIDDDRPTEEAHRRLAEAVPFAAKARNTFMAWGVRTILADLYDWHEPITESNWRSIDAIVAERYKDPNWGREILKRAHIAKTATELWRGKDGRADDIFLYSLEWGFFSRAQWGQPDIPVFELERVWNATECGRPIPVTFDRSTAPPLAKTIKTADDAREAVAHYCSLIPYERVFSTATHMSTDIDYTLPDDATMNAALKRRANATDHDRDIYSSYITHLFLSELEKHGDTIAYQFSFAAEPLPFETSSRLSQRSVAQIAEVASRYPKLKFLCFISSLHGDQSMCTIAREVPNFYLFGYWWHNFFPYFIRGVMEERLDMLPLNKQVGFFTDAYCVDWCYAKAKLIRKLMAEVLAKKIEIGQYSCDDAVAIAKALVHDSTCEILGWK